MFYNEMMEIFSKFMNYSGLEDGLPFQASSGGNGDLFVLSFDVSVCKEGADRLVGVDPPNGLG